MIDAMFMLLLLGSETPDEKNVSGRTSFEVLTECKE